MCRIYSHLMDPFLACSWKDEKFIWPLIKLDFHIISRCKIFLDHMLIRQPVKKIKIMPFRAYMKWMVSKRWRSRGVSTMKYKSEKLFRSQECINTILCTIIDNYTRTRENNRILYAHNSHSTRRYVKLPEIILYAEIFRAQDAQKFSHVTTTFFTF